MAGYGGVDDPQQCMEDRILNEVGLCKLLLPTGESSQNCIECGDSIPEPRRVALPGVKTCIPCQKIIDTQRPKIKVMSHIL